MKWFEMGSLLFKEWKKMSMWAIILFPITIVYFALWVVNFLLFFVQYIFAFPLEAAGINNTSGIKSDDDEYVKKSKLGFGIIIGIFFACYIIITQATIYFPICITSLWMDALGFCIFKKDAKKFEISKTLLQR